jgi:hypothetical protein
LNPNLNEITAKTEKMDDAKFGFPKVEITGE